MKHDRTPEQDIVRYARGALVSTIEVLRAAYQLTGQVFVRFRQKSEDETTRAWLTLASTEMRYMDTQVESEAIDLQAKVAGIAEGSPGYTQSSEIIGSAFRLETPRWQQKSAKRKRKNR